MLRKNVHRESVSTQHSQNYTCLLLDLCDRLTSACDLWESSVVDSIITVRLLRGTPRHHGCNAIIHGMRSMPLLSAQQKRRAG